jgi:hypothetical protein
VRTRYVARRRRSYWRLILVSSVFFSADFVRLLHTERKIPRTVIPINDTSFRGLNIVPRFRIRSLISSPSWRLVIGQRGRYYLMPGTNQTQHLVQSYLGLTTCCGSEDGRRKSRSLLRIGLRSWSTKLAHSSIFESLLRYNAIVLL